VGAESRKNQAPWQWSSAERRAGLPLASGGESSAILLRKHFVNASPNFYCMAAMKRLILKNWRAKLISLLLATALWYLIKKNVATTPSPSESQTRPTASESR